MTGSLRPWSVQAVLLMAGMALLVSGVGWQESALAAGPRFDPPLLPGLDVRQAVELRECLVPLFEGKPCFRMMW